MEDRVKYLMPGWINPANLFTLARLVLSPFVITAILRRNHEEALVLFSAAAFTDAIDGALARHCGWTTRAGAYLDPIADKMLLSGCYVALASIGSLPWWLVSLILGRDLLILAAAGFIVLSGRRRDLSPSRWGKFSTLLQALTAVSWLVNNAVEARLVHTVAAALVWPTAGLTFWSGIHYAWRATQFKPTD